MSLWSGNGKEREGGREGDGERGERRTALEIHGIETEEDFVVRHDVGTFFDGCVRSFGVPCAQDCVVILRYDSSEAASAAN